MGRLTNFYQCFFPFMVAVMFSGRCKIYCNSFFRVAVFFSSHFQQAGHSMAKLIPVCQRLGCVSFVRWSVPQSMPCQMIPVLHRWVSWLLMWWIQSWRKIAYKLWYTVINVGFSETKCETKLSEEVSCNGHIDQWWLFGWKSWTIMMA